MSNKQLPIISADQCIKALQREGFIIARQRGSHITMKHPERRIAVIVPNHRELRKGTLKTIINQAGLTVEEFKKLL